MTKIVSPHLTAIAHFLKTAAATNKGPMTRSDIFSKCPSIKSSVSTQNSLNTLLHKAEKDGTLKDANIGLTRTDGRITYHYIVEPEVTTESSLESIDLQLIDAQRELVGARRELADAQAKVAAKINEIKELAGKL